MCRGVFRQGGGGHCAGVNLGRAEGALCRGVFRAGHCAGVYLGRAKGGIVQGCI